jgi:homocysteine S-methyltransferase
MSLLGALTERPVVLDGGLATELERRGHDLSGGLWSARLLSEAPEAIRAVHLAFLAAGADVVTTASYQASPEGLAAQGRPPAEGLSLIARSVALAREAVAEHGAGWVAGSVGPYGAMLADGSEYTGDYGPDVTPAGLRAFHRPRIAALVEAGVDILAAETVPSLVEAEALAAELEAAGVPAWLSLTTVVEDGVVRTRRGEPAQEAFALAADVDAIVATGVNCTEPAGLAGAVRLARETSGKPGVAYPNSGERFDVARRAWVGAARPLDARGLLDAGARLIGGCCRVTPAQIAQVAALTKS